MLPYFTAMEFLRSRLGRNTVIAAGIHWDGLIDEDIQTITMLCQAIKEQIIVKYKTFFG